MFVFGQPYIRNYIFKPLKPGEWASFGCYNTEQVQMQKILHLLTLLLNCDLCLAPYHFLWRKGVDPLLNEGLCVVLGVMLPILLLLEADEPGGIALLPLGQLLLRVR